MTHNGHEEKLNTASAKLASFDHRVSFAVSRINILKGEYPHRDRAFEINTSFYIFIPQIWVVKTNDSQKRENRSCNF